jgi:RNA polymerase sigma-70 factor, ECF subfamily
MGADAPAPTEQARRLLAAARAGDADALGRLMELYRGYLLAVAGQELSAGALPKAGPSDVVQETFLVAHRLFANFQGEQGDDFRAWLRAILRNKVSELHGHYFGAQKRQAGREQSLDQSGEHGPWRETLAGGGSTPSGAAVRNEEEQRLEAALARLPELSRQVIVWRKWDGLSFAEIGHRLGRSEDAARMLFGRALERLQQEIESDHA